MKLWHAKGMHWRTFNCRKSLCSKDQIKKVIDEAKSKGFNANYEEKYDYDLVWKGDVEYRPVMKLDTDFAVAMRKLEKA